MRSPPFSGPCRFFKARRPVSRGYRTPCPKVIDSACPLLSSTAARPEEPAEYPATSNFFSGQGRLQTPSSASSADACVFRGTDSSRIDCDAHRGDSPWISLRDDFGSAILVAILHGALVKLSQLACSRVQGGENHLPVLPPGPRDHRKVIASPQDAAETKGHVGNWPGFPREGSVQRVNAIANRRLTLRVAPPCSSLWPSRPRFRS